MILYDPVFDTRGWFGTFVSTQGWFNEDLLEGNPAVTSHLDVTASSSSFTGSTPSLAIVTALAISAAAFTFASPAQAGTVASHLTPVAASSTWTAPAPSLLSGAFLAPTTAARTFTSPAPTYAVVSGLSVLGAKSAKGAAGNVLTDQRALDTANWDKVAVTVTANQTTAPDGTLTADKVAASSSVSFVSLSQSRPIAGRFAKATVYIKKGSGATAANRFTVRNDSLFPALQPYDLLAVSINYDTQAITYIAGPYGRPADGDNSGAVLTDVGNGWLKLELTPIAAIYPGDSIALGACFISSPGTSGDYAYVWGADLRAADSAGATLSAAPSLAPTPAARTWTAVPAQLDSVVVSSGVRILYDPILDVRGWFGHELTIFGWFDPYLIDGTNHVYTTYPPAVATKVAAAPASTVATGLAPAAVSRTWAVPQAVLATATTLAPAAAARTFTAIATSGSIVNGGQGETAEGDFVAVAPTFGVATSLAPAATFRTCVAVAPALTGATVLAPAAAAIVFTAVRPAFSAEGFTFLTPIAAARSFTATALTEATATTFAVTVASRSWAALSPALAGATTLAPVVAARTYVVPTLTGAIGNVLLTPTPAATTFVASAASYVSDTGLSLAVDAPATLFNAVAPTLTVTTELGTSFAARSWSASSLRKAIGAISMRVSIEAAVSMGVEVEPALTWLTIIEPTRDT